MYAIEQCWILNRKIRYIETLHFRWIDLLKFRYIDAWYVASKIPMYRYLVCRIENSYISIRCIFGVCHRKFRDVEISIHKNVELSINRNIELSIYRTLVSYPKFWSIGTSNFRYYWTWFAPPSPGIPVLSMQICSELIFRCTRIGYRNRIELLYQVLIVFFHRHYSFLSIGTRCVSNSSIGMVSKSIIGIVSESIVRHLSNSIIGSRYRIFNIRREANGSRR